MTQPTREDEHPRQPVAAQPIALRILQPLDLGLEDAAGLVCDIDDPDCVLPAVISQTGEEDDA